MQREWNEAVFVIFRASKYQYEKYMYIYNVKQFQFRRKNI